MAINDPQGAKFAHTIFLIERGLKEFESDAKTGMHVLSSGDFIAHLWTDGWDDNSIIDLLDDATKGGYSKDPSLSADPSFRTFLAWALLAAISPVPALDQNDNSLLRSTIRELSTKLGFADATRLTKTSQADDFRIPVNLGNAAGFLLRGNSPDYFQQDENGVNRFMLLASGLHPKSAKIIDAIIEMERQRDPALSRLTLADHGGKTALDYTLEGMGRVSDGYSERKQAITRNLMTAIYLTEDAVIDTAVHVEVKRSDVTDPNPYANSSDRYEM